MFPATEFLRLAQWLLNDARQHPGTDESEARVRAALGRAYYGLYLLVRAEIAHKHGIPVQRLQHGAVYTRLQSPQASVGVRELGRDLQLLYMLRQNADYELDPAPRWKTQLQDPSGARILVRRAEELAREVPQLDFSPVVALLDPRRAG